MESHLLFLQAWHHLFRSRMDSLAKAIEYFKKARQADSGTAKANAGFSIAWTEAEDAFLGAIRLNPNYAAAHHLGSVAYLMPMGRGDQAVREMEIALDLDPLSTIVRCDVGTMCT